MRYIMVILVAVFFVSTCVRHNLDRTGISGEKQIAIESVIQAATYAITRDEYINPKGIVVTQIGSCWLNADLSCADTARSTTEITEECVISKQLTKSLERALGHKVKTPWDMASNETLHLLREAKGSETETSLVLLLPSSVRSSADGRDSLSVVRLALEGTCPNCSLMLDVRVYISDRRANRYTERLFAGPQRVSIQPVIDSGDTKNYEESYAGCRALNR